MDSEELLVEEHPLVVIVGPTASGKSDLAMMIAKKYGGEIISADSQTIRRDMDIGTAKPSASDRRAVKHHLLDIVGPYDDFNAAQFQNLAKKAIEEIARRGKLSILAGGTGLYVDALLYDFKFSKESARRDEQNPRHLAKDAPSKREKLRPNTLIIGLEINKEELKERIERRVEQIFEQGFIQEVKSLIKKHGPPPKRFDAIGYSIILSNTDSEGRVDELAAKERFAIADRQYAKRQLTWFKRNKDINWIKNYHQADELVSNFVSRFDTIAS